MGKALPIVVALVLLVYAFFDLYATPRTHVLRIPKVLWLAVVILLPVVGPLLWLFFGTARTPRPPKQPRGRGALGPDDDPDFLRGL